MLLYWLSQGTEEDADDEDYQRAMDLPDELKQELLTYQDRLVAGEGHPRGGVCLWLDESTGGCQHYEHRPSICREFAMGSEECHSWRREYDVV